MILGVEQRTKPTSVAYGHFDGSMHSEKTLASILASSGMVEAESQSDPNPFIGPLPHALLKWHGSKQTANRLDFGFKTTWCFGR